VRDVAVVFGRAARLMPAVRGVSFEMRRHEVVALVDESDSAKSTTGLALLGLLTPDTAVVRGSINLTRKDGLRSKSPGFRSASSARCAATTSP